MRAERTILDIDGAAVDYIGGGDLLCLLYVFYPDVFRGRSLGLAYDHLFICLLSPYHKALAYHR